jgi:hypothetical protein
MSIKVCDVWGNEFRRIPLLCIQVGKFLLGGNRKAKHYVCLVFVSFQRDAAVSSPYFISLQDLSTCFGCTLHPSSGVLKTVYTTTGTSHMMWQVSTPDDGCKEHPNM